MQFSASTGKNRSSIFEWKHNLNQTRGRLSIFCLWFTLLMTCSMIFVPVNDAEETTFSSAASIAANDSSYDNQAITVDGCTLTVDGTHSFTQINLINNAVLTHSGPDDALRNPLDITITGDALIEAGSRINLSGKGYTAGNGPGKGEDASNYAGGAGHGGNGGSSISAAGGQGYGNVTEPVTLGSGGGNRDNYNGGSGGGALKLTVNGTLTLNGDILANGAYAGTYSGGGAGGSVYLTAETITGSGSVSADGGNGGNGAGGGGAGGRIAVYYGTLDATVGMSAFGGSGYECGGPGTIYLKASGSDLSELLILNNGNTSGVTPVSGTYETVTIRGGGTIALMQTDPVSMVSLLISENTQVTHPANNSDQTYVLDLTVTGNMQIEDGSSIDVSSKGYTGGEGTGQGEDSTNSAGGAGHGGNGGRARYTGRGESYGSPAEPVTIGSGGGSRDSYNGGSGGGALKLTVNGVFTLNGDILADGGNGSYYAGGGSGGSVYLIAGTITGFGSITAHGGNGYSNVAGGGAGGRIAVYYSSLDATIDMSAYGGSGYEYGGTGTIYLKSSETNSSELLLLTNKYTIGVTPVSGTYETVTIRGGGTLSLLQTDPVSMTSLLISENTKLTHPANDTDQTYTLDLTVTGNMQIEEGSSIDVSSRGYTGGEGEGQGEDSTNYAGGAGHGGNGGRAMYTGRGESYGSPAEPVTIGSGGGNRDSYNGGSGGGALKLTVNGVFTLNGDILADGGNGEYYAGGGAGGSVYLAAGTVTGSGSITAHGGNGYSNVAGGGAGGRIAVYYGSLDATIDMSAYGGSGYEYGGTGTIYLKSSETNSSELLLLTNKYTIGVTPVSGTYETVTIRGGGTLSLLQTDPVSMTSLLISENTKLTHPANDTDQTYTLDLTVTGNMEIEEGSSIDVSSRGYTGGEGTGQGENASNYPGGAGHGGNGGSSNYADGGGSYGSLAEPVTIGSGGGNRDNYNGGSGGGALKLTVNGVFILNGDILADGGNGEYYAGGGAGGSVYLTAGTVTGSGSVTAHGGNGYSNVAGGGAGGRIAVYYGALDPNITMSAYGGSGYEYGGIGTIYLKSSDSSNGSLYLDNNGNTSSTTPISGEYGEVVIRGGGEMALEQTGSVSMASLTITGETAVTHRPNSTDQAYTLDLTVTGNITIESGSSIDVSGKGYAGGEGPGQGNDYAGSSGTGGAGHGGHGGSGQYADAGQSYGDIAEPTTIGSGGGNNTYYDHDGGSGGGAVKLTVGGTLNLNGNILANGANGYSGYGYTGGGAGGSVYITAGGITGSGYISANGGTGYYSGGGGAGGRIAVYYTSLDDTVDISAYGTTGNESGGTGTIYLKSLQDNSSELQIANNGITSGATPISGTYETVSIQGGGMVSLEPAGSVSIGSLAITGNTALSHPANGTNQEYTLNLTITGDMTIESGSSIDVSEKGYAGGEGPGQGNDYAGSSGTGGAGHGGHGGSGQYADAGQSYGDIAEPTAFGSGGGNNTYYDRDGGAGGGAVKLTVGGTLNLNGNILANGANGYSGYGYTGGGAGGSVYITAGGITGSGYISANGGTGYYSGGGGAGGRIAVYYDTLDSQIVMSAYGRSGYKNGGAGTIYLKSSKNSLSDLLLANDMTSGITPVSGDYGEIIVRGRCKISLEQTGSISMTTLTISEDTTLSHRANESDQEYTLNLTVTGDINIESGASIDVSEKGYAGGEGPGQGDDYAGSSGTGGAGHGGQGGSGRYADGGPSYGDNVEPTTLGSGGGNNTYYDRDGGAGGGALRLTVGGTVNLNGNILANGANGYNGYGYTGGGSGGSIYITAWGITGSGYISANGGTGYYSGGGGAGGRIALNYFTLSPGDEILEHVTVSGANGNETGEDGTIYIPGYANPIITTNTGIDFTTSDANIVLEGTCPSETARILVNDTEDNVTYLSGETTWQAAVSLAEGHNYIYVQALDGTDTPSGRTLIIITLDTTPAGAPAITTNAGGDMTVQSASFVLEGTCTEDAAAILVNGSEEGVIYTPGGTTWSYEAELSIGDHVFTVTSLDGSGNESPADTITITFENNRADPPVNLTPADGDEDINPNVTLTASTFQDADPEDTHTSTQWQVRSADGSYDDPVFFKETATDLTAITLSYGTLALDTTYYWQVRYLDSRGSWTDYSDETSFSTLLDTDPPETTISSGPADGEILYTNTAGFSWSGEDNVQWLLTYATQLDDNDWTAYSTDTSIQYTGLADGEHVFRVKTKDDSGNEDATPAVRSFIIQNAPEDVTNISVKSGSDSLAFTWDHSADTTGDLSHYLIYFNNGEAVTLSKNENQYEATGLASSTAYSFKITAVDTSGNESSGASVTAYTVMENPSIHTIEELNGRITLSWSAAQPSEYVKIYRIYKSTGSFDSVEGMSPVLTTAGTSASIAGLANGTTYYFTVTTVNLSGGEDQNGVTAVPATPRMDSFGPVISNITLNGEPLTSGMTVDSTATINCNASDESGVSRVEFLINGTVFSDTSGSNYTCQWDILTADDGSFTIQITAYDTLGNTTTVSTTVTVALPLPPAPVITAPASGELVNDPSITISGTAQALADVMVYLNGAETGSWTAAGANGSFSLEAVLSEGENSIQVKARNRAGEGPLSTAVTVTLDTDIPDSPTHLEASSGTSGTVVLSWLKPLNSTVEGYNLYRSTASFETTGGAQVLNTNLITATALTDLPDEDGQYYYGVTAVDYAGNESALSALAAGTSDRAAPQAVSIEYAPQGAYDSDTGRMGPGMVYLTLTVSEPLAATPFLSINPLGATPMTIDLDQASDLVYTGLFVIESSAPTGTAYAVFSARDDAGNRGDTISSGGSVEIDTEGPSLIDIRMEPDSPVKNDETEPVELTVVLGLDEEVKDGETPVLSYLLSGGDGTAIAITDISLIETQDGHAQSFQAVFTLPGDAGLTGAQTLEFIYSAVDDLDNSSDEITADNAFQIYQGDLPPLDAPTNLSGTSLAAGDIKLSWDEVDLASGYVLYRQAPGESGLTLLVTLEADTEYTDNPGLDGTYTYAVASLRNENGQTAESGKSASIEVESDATAPGAPTDLALELTAQGIQSAWTAPAYTEAVTYSLYRADTVEITSVEGLTPIRTGIEDVTAMDTNPSDTCHRYAVTAVDAVGNESAPSNSPYLNFDLLPVNDLTVTRVDEENPVITWAHSGSTISGFNIYLGAKDSLTRLNTGQLTESTYTDSGYDKNDRRYTVIAVDNNNEESLGRSIVLPALIAALPEGAGLKRGLMNRLSYTVTNSGTSVVEDAVLRVTVESYEHVSEAFDLGAGESRTVSVVIGGYSDLPDTAALKTVIEIEPNDGETVLIETNAEIEVGTGMLKLSFTNDEFVRGTSGEIVFTLENTGDEQIEIVTAQSGGSASADITLYLTDQDGNTLATGSYTQTFGGNVVCLSNGLTVARIDAGSTFESKAMSIGVPSGAPDELSLILEISSIYYSIGDAQQVEMEGVKTSREITLIDTAYYGEILSVAPKESYGDEDIEITGRAVDRNDGEPLAQVPLTLVITINGFEKIIDVYTVSDGSFSYAFDPIDGVYGEYQVCAVHPDLSDRPVQARFSIIEQGSTAINFTPATYNLTALRNYEYDIPVTVTAGNAAQATHLEFVYDASDQDGQTLPTGIHVDTGEVVSSLGAGGTQTMTVTVWADNTADEDDTVVLRLVSDETADEGIGTLTVNIKCVEPDSSDAGPVLSYSPSYVETGLALDDSASETLTLENKGFSELADLSVELINTDGTAAPDWVVLNLPSDQGSIDVGESVELTLMFYPTEDTVEEGEYDFYIQVAGSNCDTANILVHAAVTGSGIGNVLFKVSDIYTATIDAETGEMIQGLSGAALTFQNETVTSISYSGSTDEYGEILLSDLPTGRYKYYLTADNHDQVTGRVWIKPGITVTEDVFMSYNLVSVEWTVTETTIEDKYEIVLSATYETDVPAAVVIADPASITLPDMEPGDVLLGEIRFTNYGLIRADEIEFALPESDQYFKYEFLASIPESIGAKESITVPYRVTCLSSLSGEDEGAGGSCFTYTKSTCLWYLYVCSNGTSYEDVRCVVFTHAMGDCSGDDGIGGVGSGSSTGTGSTGTGGSTGSGSGGWWGGVSGRLFTGSSGSGYTPSDSIPDGVVCTPVAVCEVTDECCKTRAREMVGSYVDLMNGEYEDDVADMSLKIPGDTLSVHRYYYDQTWHFSDTGMGLEFNYDVDASVPESITKDGVDYEKSDTAGTVYTYDKVKTITRDDEGYLWKDKVGSWIRYDLDGKILSRGSQDRTSFSYVYDEDDPDLLVHIVDSLGDTVLWYEYDPDGRVLLVRDGDGRQVSYQYTSGQLTTVTDLLGNEFYYTYDSDGRMTSKTDQAGRTTQMEYNSFGWISAIIDPNGNRTEYSYAQGDSQSELYNMITYPNGRIKETWYDELGRVTRVDLNGTTMEESVYENRKRYKTDERGHTTTYEFDEWNQLIKKTYPDGSTEETEYDPDTKLKVKRTERNGTVATYEYDDHGNITQRILAPGTDDEITYQFTYDSDGNQLTQRILGDDNTLESLTVMTYDEYGNMASITDPEGHTTRYTYNSLGMPLTREDPLGGTWTYVYDVDGSILEETDPLGNTVTYEYDAVGNQIKQTDAMGGEYEYAFDGKDRLIRQTNPSGQTTVYELNFEGKVLQDTDPEGRYLTYEYDKLGRLISKSNSAGKQVTYEYDEESAVGCSSCSAGSTGEPSLIRYPHLLLHQVYDSLGRKIEDIYKSEEGETLRERLTEYNDMDSISAVTDQNGLTTAYEYNGVGRKVAEVRPDGSRIEYAYDDRKNLISLTDANGHVTRFQYDRNNRMTAEIRPDEKTTTYEYDANGNLARKTNARGQVAEYDYNAVNKPVKVRYYENSSAGTPEKTLTLSYNKAGQLTDYTDGQISVHYEYDQSHRKISETVNYGAFSTTYQYDYYGNGLKKGYTGPDGTAYGYTYTQDNRIESITIPGAGTISYNDYEWTSPNTVLLPGGTRKEFEYDTFYRTTGIAVKDPGENPVMNQSFEYDQELNITSISTSTGTTAYNYDDQYHLVSATRPSGETISYTLDPMGNRLSQTGTTGDWEYNDNDQLTAYADTTVTYDADGNMATKTTGTETFEYTYDFENRLVQITSDLQGVMAAYSYDPFGRRISKTVDDETTYFGYADEGLTAEYNDKGEILKSYGYVPGAKGSIDPVFVKIGAAYYFYHNDTVKKPVKITDMAGAVVWSAVYDEYGKASVDEGSTIVSNLRLPGQYFDEESGLHYNYARYYDPDTGRYLETDPIGMGNRPDAGEHLTGKSCAGSFSDVDINYYLYADANPVNKIDPFGTFSFSGGVKGSLGCIPLGPIAPAGIKISGKLQFTRCCNCDTKQMEWKTTIEACIHGCIGVSLPSLKKIGKVEGTKCCPTSPEWSASLKASCSGFGITCSVSYTVKSFPSGKFAYGCKTVGVSLGMTDAITKGPSCSAGGCASVSF